MTSLLDSMVYDGDRTMVFHDPYLITESQVGRPTHQIRYDRLETAFLSFLTAEDWKSVAGTEGPDYSPEQLLAAVLSGDSQLRLKLRSEISKRVVRINLEFDDETPVRALIERVNGFTDFIVFQ
jgi:hypothetical protein